MSNSYGGRLQGQPRPALSMPLVKVSQAILGLVLLILVMALWVSLWVPPLSVS